MENRGTTTDQITSAVQTLWRLDSPVRYWGASLDGVLTEGATSYVLESTRSDAPRLNADGSEARVVETLLFPADSAGRIIGDSLTDDVEMVLTARFVAHRSPALRLRCDECEGEYTYPAPGAPNPDGADALHCTDACRKTDDARQADAVTFGAVAV